MTSEGPTQISSLDIHIDNIYLWSDSKTVLNYLHNRNTNFGPSIMRRCNKIRQTTNVEDWNYIPTDLNIADALSLGILLENPDVLSSWLTGSNFMKEASSFIILSRVKMTATQLKQQQQILIKSLMFTSLK